jgi:WhiB family redox-sensing transcriptional regulator
MDSDLFYPVKVGVSPGQGGKAVCEECPVVAECLEYVLSRPTPELGIWGGTNERDRRILRRERRKTQPG